LSRTVTCTAGEMAPPAGVLLGWTVKTSCDGAPGTMSKELLNAGLRVPEVAISEYPTVSLLTVRLENEAIPPTAATVFVPPRVPPFGLSNNATVTLLLKPVAVLPSESCAVT
jgi:hypothetical protein